MSDRLIRTYIKLLLEKRREHVAIWGLEHRSDHPKNTDVCKAEDPDDVFGMYAFADDPDYGRHPETSPIPPHETNTDIEDDVFSAIIHHTGAGLGRKTQKRFTSKEADLIRSILKAGKYSDVLKEPTQKYVYRGISRTDDAFRSMFGELLSLKKNDPIPAKGSADVEFMYNMNGNATAKSWTIDFDTAVTYSGVGSRKKSGLISIIMTAEVAANPHAFITGPGGYYKLDHTERYWNDYEVISLFPVKVCKIRWVRMTNSEEESQAYKTATLYDDQPDWIPDDDLNGLSPADYADHLVSSGASSKEKRKFIDTLRGDDDILLKFIDDADWSVRLEVATKHLPKKWWKQLADDPSGAVRYEIMTKLLNLPAQSNEELAMLWKFTTDELQRIRYHLANVGPHEIRDALASDHDSDVRKAAKRR